jgi:hypothetical protein
VKLWMSLAALLLCVALAFSYWLRRRHSPAALSASLAPIKIMANGYDHAVVTIRSDEPPMISFAGERQGAELCDGWRPP